MKKLIMEVIHACYKQRRAQKGTCNSLSPHLNSALSLSLEKTTFNFVNCFFPGGYLLISKCALSSFGFSGKQTLQWNLCAGVSWREAQEQHLSGKEAGLAEGEGELQ